MTNATDIATMRLSYDHRVLITNILDDLKETESFGTRKILVTMIEKDEKYAKAVEDAQKRVSDLYSELKATGGKLESLKLRIHDEEALLELVAAGASIMKAVAAAASPFVIGMFGLVCLPLPASLYAGAKTLNEAASSQLELKTNIAFEVPKLDQIPREKFTAKCVNKEWFKAYDRMVEQYKEPAKLDALKQLEVVIVKNDKILQKLEDARSKLERFQEEGQKLVSFAEKQVAEKGLKATAHKFLVGAASSFDQLLSKLTTGQGVDETPAKKPSLTSKTSAEVLPSDQMNQNPLTDGNQGSLKMDLKFPSEKEPS